MLFVRKCRNLGLLARKVVYPGSMIARISAANLSIAQFSTAKESVKMEFKAETKKLLDIVAKSLYTDS